MESKMKLNELNDWQAFLVLLAVSFVIGFFVTPSSDFVLKNQIPYKEVLSI
ncbi:hypothetical protein HC864_03415 [Candidatus Gracilibacteria bacterium]|nr:hypothetical protein [Thermales bacterium]NJL96836.1 hypothetical protein [Candidatus Gracilibacteria bacterium]